MDQTTYEIFSVVDDGQNWVVSTKRPNGIPHTFGLSHHTWAARAAEYGIGLDDIDTLMDIGLHENFEGIDQTHPDFVYNNHEASAREKLLARIADTKRRHAVTDPGNLLQAVRDHHANNPHDDFHKKHKELVRTIRKARVKS